MGKLTLLHGDVLRGRALQELVRPIELITVRRAPLGPRLSIHPVLVGRRPSGAVVKRVVGQARRGNDIVDRVCRRESALLFPPLRAHVLVWALALDLPKTMALALGRVAVYPWRRSGAV